MKKKIITGLATILAITAFYIFIQFSKVGNVASPCFNSDFDKVFEKKGNLKLNKIYDFAEIFNCEDWDKIIIVGGEKAGRLPIFLKEGVALPRINYSNRLDGVLLFYLIKDGELISSTISLWQQDFLYFENLNDFDYLSLDKQDAIFRCVELETIGHNQDMLTFKLLDNNDKQ